MSNKDWKRRTREDVEPQEKRESHHYVQNLPPPQLWRDFDHFWSTCVKNGSPLIKDSLKMHLRSMGWLENQVKWIQGAQHFGIDIEK